MMREDFVSVMKDNQLGKRSFRIMEIFLIFAGLLREMKQCFVSNFCRECIFPEMVFEILQYGFRRFGRQGRGVVVIAHVIFIPKISCAYIQPRGFIQGGMF